MPDVPPASRGRTSLRLTSAGNGANATDFYKNLGPGTDELYVRYYAGTTPASGSAATTRR